MSDPLFRIRADLVSALAAVDDQISFHRRQATYRDEPRWHLPFDESMRQELETDRGREYSTLLADKWQTARDSLVKAAHDYMVAARATHLRWAGEGNDDDSSIEIRNDKETR